MARKYKTILIIINLVLMFTIISIPTFILLAEYSHSSRIDKSLKYMHSATTPPLRRELNLNTDLGRIDINYNSEPVDYLVRIDVTIEMAGPNLAGKSYLDFFNLVWQNTSSLVNFTMELKVGIDQLEALSLIKNVDIIVTLRAGVIFNITINSKIQGDVKITVPWKTTVGNVLTNISKGRIQYAFNYCFIEGNITGIIQGTGNIDFIVKDVEYTQNSTWSLYTYDGDISIQIFQNTDMNANVSGTIYHSYGNINFKYEDDNDYNGAYFTLHYNPDDLALPQVISQVVGFDSDFETGQNIFYLDSYDYPAQNNYNLLFYNSNGLYLLLDLDSS